MRLMRDSPDFVRGLRGFLRLILHHFRLELMLCCALLLPELFARFLRLTRCRLAARSALSSGATQEAKNAGNR